MHLQLDQLVDTVGTLLDLAGVAVIAVGVLLGAAPALLAARRGGQRETYDRLRRTIGRSTLLGLEILVAADIVETVAVLPTLPRIALLAAVVAVRTLLSLSLQVELDGRWPWRPAPPVVPGAAGATR
ncbi:DUF1622 domain-containing protein [Dactylosporangium sp. CA-139114]|uniref:DUF1622 domain-containing protein n=1 Tax=Dactylosporangium sp. CA-139114 TaxID=3239931 RepID=UPI003D958C94